MKLFFKYILSVITKNIAMLSNNILVRCLRLILLFMLFTGSVSFAEIRYVKADSHNPAPPYTSWATASDSIQKCLDICNYGDTVYVGKGTYVEILNVPEGLNIAGAGIDSTLIDTRTIFTTQYAGAITFNKKGSISDLSIMVYPNLNHGTAIYTPGNENNYINICNLKISSSGIAIWNSNGAGTISNCIIENVKIGIIAYNLNGSNISIIKNTISATSQCIVIDPSICTLIIHNNILMPTEAHAKGYLGTLATLSTLSNNLIITGENGAQTGISANASPHHIQNNMVYDKSNSFQQGAFLLRDNTVSVNNYVEGAIYGFVAYPGHAPIIKHNNSWGNDLDYANFTPDSTNISADPMFVNPDSLDFRLQKFSPMIDAGDPEINDLDGSRSDIGLLGGPYGGFYEYIDLAPKIPKGFTAQMLHDNILLRWNKNTEFDFSHYTVYRDTVSDSFTPDSTNLLGASTDTMFIDNTLISSSAVYYKIIAVDLTGNQSPPSPAASVITGMDGATAEVNNPDYRLYPNYPNPFNPSTTITYTIRKPGRVELTAYDIQGELKEVLVNQFQEPGTYQVRYSIKPDALVSGVIIIRIQVKDHLNRIIFSDVIKALIVK